MNDPKEGLLINELLNLDNKIPVQELAFISCFTLHHDSLNQFRLYGKEENKEASGLSLVLSKYFFSQDPNLTYMMNYREYLNLNPSYG
jgi:protein O-GlcNAc transferase